MEATEKYDIRNPPLNANFHILTAKRLITFTIKQLEVVQTHCPVARQAQVATSPNVAQV